MLFSNLMRIIKTVYKGLVSIPQNIPGGVIMKRKAFTLTLAAFLLASLAACSNGTNSSKNRKRNHQCRGNICF